MAKQRNSLSSLMKAAILVLFVVVWAWSHHRPGSGIHADNAGKIKPAMTVQEVVNIMRDPPGDYTTLPVDLLDYSDFKRADSNQIIWVNDHYCIRVLMDSEGKVVNVNCVQSWTDFVRTVENMRPSYWQRFKRWLRIS